MPEFVFANRAGLEMFETSSSSLQDLAWDKTLDEDSLKLSYATFTQVLQQVTRQSDESRKLTVFVFVEGSTDFWVLWGEWSTGL